LLNRFESERNMTTLEMVRRDSNRVRPLSRNVTNKSARRLFVGILVAAAVAIAAPAQEHGSPQPPAISQVLAALPSDEPRLAEILASQPQEPAGPGDMLRNYEQGMAVVSQQTYAELVQVAEAARQGQITREQAEHLSFEIYQTGMMQFQLLSTLHQILESDLAKAAQRSGAAQLTGSAASFRGVGRADASPAARESIAGPTLVPLTQ
jgi:hypothetical protein